MPEYEQYTPTEDMFVDSSEKILKLSDELAEEIILENINDQLTSELEPLVTRINYIKLFREKYDKIKDSENYDENEVKNIVARIAESLAIGLHSKYGVELGTDLDFSTPLEYLYDLETLYEFLFIRHFENLVDYFKNELNINKKRYIETYTNLMDNETNSQDLFVAQSRKKFKNKQDVIIIHFINNIIQDIIDMTKSAYDMFSEICQLDIYEEYNNRMNELIINYGNKLVLNHDSETARLYLLPLKNPEVYSELRNSILISYLEGCELND